MALIVESKESRVWLRKGLYFDMGNARLVVEGETWAVVDPLMLDGAR